MNKLLCGVIALWMLTTVAVGQETIRRTETTEIRTETATGTETQTEVTTIVREYVTYLRKVYLAVGVSEDLIVRIVTIDIEIFEARVRLDFERVRVLVREEVQILTPAVAEKVITYVKQQPAPPVLPVYARPVWTESVTISNENVEVKLNEPKVRQAVQSAHIDVQQVQQVTKNVDVKTGEVRASASNAKEIPTPTAQPFKAATPSTQASPAAATGTPGATGSPASTSTPSSGATPSPRATTATEKSPSPGAQPTPKSGDTPASGTTPAPSPAANTGETPKAAETPSAANTPGRGITPSAGQSPTVSGREHLVRRRGGRGATSPAPAAAPATPEQSPDASPTAKAREPDHAAASIATPSSTSSTSAKPKATPKDNDAPATQN